MSEIGKILIQLDTDAQCSTFDGIVAVDSGVDHLLRYSNVTIDQVENLVHGAMFTRSQRKLASTAIFVGGSNVKIAEEIYTCVCKTFFGNVQVSVAMDASGCNTTSVAAVKLGFDRMPKLSNQFESISALVLGSTGAVGQRIVKLLVDRGLTVHCHSRSKQKADAIIESIAKASASSSSGELRGTDVSGDRLTDLAKQCPLVFNAGAAGIQFFDQNAMASLASSQGVLVDLNTVPPSGFDSVGPNCDQTRGNRHVIGALTVGNLKMKVHKAVLKECFHSNDRKFALLEIDQLVQSM